MNISSIYDYSLPSSNVNFSMFILRFFLNTEKSKRNFKNYLPNTLNIKIDFLPKMTFDVKNPSKPPTRDCLHILYKKTISQIIVK